VQSCHAKVQARRRRLWPSLRRPAQVLLGLAEIGDLQRQQAGPILDGEIFRLQPCRTMIQVGSGAQPACLLGLRG
jgi:hypothetical protein